MDEAVVPRRPDFRVDETTVEVEDIHRANYGY